MLLISILFKFLIVSKRAFIVFAGKISLSLQIYPSLHTAGFKHWFLPEFSPGIWSLCIDATV